MGLECACSVSSRTLQHCTLCSYVALGIVPAKVGLGLGWWDCRGCRNPIMGCSTPPLANFMNSQFSRKFIGTVLVRIVKMLQFYHIDEKEFTDISGYPSYPFLILLLIWGGPRSMGTSMNLRLSEESVRLKYWSLCQRHSQPEV